MPKFEPFISSQTSCALQFRAAALRRFRHAFLPALLVCASPVHTVLADVCSVPSFGPPRTFEVVGGAAYVAVGDFNGDGKPDLTVFNYGSEDSTTHTYTNGGISVLLGIGEGNFQAASTHATGTNPVFVAVGDFNGDGEPDVAVLNQGLYGPTNRIYANSGISVLLSKGDGTFQAAVNYGAGTNPVSLAVGDFNGDGKVDLVVGNEGSWDSNGVTYVNSSISVLLSKGDGTFKNAANYGAAADPVSVAVGDFNGDGKPDLAVANNGDNSGNQGNLSVLLGKGDGTFQTAVDYGVGGARPLSVALGDFNGDGKPDLAVANLRGISISVLLGKGDGTFQNALAAVDLPLPRHPTSITVSDFNGDGIPDLIPNVNGPGASVALLGNGDGKFQPVTLNAPAAAVLAVGDFNGDGKPDLAIDDNFTNIAVLLNAGVSSGSTPTFAETGEFLAYGYGGSVAVGDFNGDGNPDLVFGDGDPTGYISLLLGKGDGTFQLAVTNHAGPRSYLVAVGDFNGDGRLDLAATGDGNGISVLLGRGDGTFQSAANYSLGLSFPWALEVTDLNGDGRLDLAVADRDSNSVWILLGKGDGTFKSGIEYGAGESPVALTIGDFNGDGKVDLAVANANGGDTNRIGLSVLLGRGDGTFQTPISYDTGGGASSLAVGDFNGDGKPDLVVVNFTKSGISVLLGKGDGAFQAAVSYDVDGRFSEPGHSVAVGDLNGDGKADLIVARGGNANHGGHFSLLVGNGDGTLQAPVTYPGNRIGSVALGDFNGDGKLDFVTTYNFDPVTGALVWLNTSCSAGPNLALMRSGAALTASWRFPSAGYVLESAASLNPASWKPADKLPVNNSGRWEVTVPTTQNQGYFRLRKP